MPTYQVTMDKTITMSLVVEADSPVNAGLLARAQMIDNDETAYISNTYYSAVDVEEAE